MTALIEVETGRLGYHEVVQHVLKNGRPRNPRGLQTYDAGWTTVVIHDPSDQLPLGVGRNLSRAVAAAEAVQLIGGFSAPELLFRISPNFRRFAQPDTQRFHGAYGERIKNQLACVLNKLHRDPDTRQAVVTLWDPWLDNLHDRRDYPCTVALRASITDGRLDLDVLMRSNDVVLGFPYDIFQFGQLQATLARLLDLPLGVYRHTAWSLHLYETDLDAARRVAAAPPGRPEVQPAGVGRPGDPLREVGIRALQLSTGRVADPTESEKWYAGALAPYVPR